MQINTGTLVQVGKVQAFSLLFKALTGQKIQAGQEAGQFFLQLGQAILSDAATANETPQGVAKLTINRGQ